MLLLTHGTHMHLSRVRACSAGAPRTVRRLVHAVRWWRKTRLCGSSASAVASSRLCLPRLWLAAVDQLHSSERLWCIVSAMQAATVSRLWCTLRTYLPTLYYHLTVRSQDSSLRTYPIIRLSSRSTKVHTNTHNYVHMHIHMHAHALAHADE